MTFFDAIAAAFNSNPVITGGITLGITGGLIAAARNAPKHILIFLRNCFTVTCELREPEIFNAFAEFIAAEQYGRQCRRISATLNRQTGKVGSTHMPSVIFAPGRGRHIVRYRNRLLWLQRARDDAGMNAEQKLFACEYMVIRMLGRNTQPSRDMLEAAVNSMYERMRGKNVTYARYGYRDWGIITMDEGRSLDSVVLRDGLCEEIVADIARFLAARERYQRIGVPYRRGYLLHGPPGCGKSALITAIATHFSMPLYILPLSAKIDDDDLLVMMQATLPRCIILIEDADAMFAEREPSDRSTRITFKGLINAIDGVAAQQGRIIFFTTNHLDRLDPALIRPGRVDLLREVEYCDYNQLMRMFLRFFPGEAIEAQVFAARMARVHGAAIAPCRVQQFLLRQTDAAIAASMVSIAQMEPMPAESLVVESQAGKPTSAELPSMSNESPVLGLQNGVHS